MIYYNHTKEADEILKLLKSADEIIRHEVILAARELFIEGAEESLIEQFELENKRNKLEILCTLGTIGTDISEMFLKDLLTKPIDTDIKLAIVESLNTVNPNYFKDTVNDNDEIQRMVKHVQDPNI